MREKFGHRFPIKKFRINLIQGITSFVYFTIRYNPLYGHGTKTAYIPNANGSLAGGGSIVGGGLPDSSNRYDVALESQIQQGFYDPHFQPCDPTSGVSLNQLIAYLFLEMPARRACHRPWVHGGENSRDAVRRVAYSAKCSNLMNNNIMMESDKV